MDVAAGQSGRPNSRATRAAGSRKRVYRACDTCRRLKEKCDGREPCTRCTRVNRQCRFSSGRREGEASTQPPQSRDFFDRERILALEKIVKHFTNVENLDQSHIVELAASLPSTKSSPHPGFGDNGDRGPFPRHPPRNDHSDELSHRDFSIRFQQDVIEDSTSELNKGHAQGSAHAHSLSALAEAATLFPPHGVALFLTDVFFEHAQTNYVYVDERSLRQRIDAFYGLGRNLEDPSWTCILLMTFAVGTQFAHLASRSAPTSGPGDKERDENVARSFYAAACRFLPDVIAAASVESVQAFLLLAVYTLAVDAAALSCTYLGLAVKIATHNAMHRSRAGVADERQAELRRRIFWTAYTLDRRICIFHGRPTSITSNDVSCELPEETAALHEGSRVGTLPNILAMIRLTENLERAKHEVSAFKTALGEQRQAAAQSIQDFKAQLTAYWHSLPAATVCRDLDPSGPLFRFNIHLALTYHLIHICVGRAFILSPDHTPSQDSVRGQLIGDGVGSALAVVDLCQTLDDEVGLARLSYTEFTTCCAAVLVLLAHGRTAPTRRIKKSCKAGIDLLRGMSVGNFSSSFDSLSIRALESALGHISTAGTAAGTDRMPAYAQFKSWAAMRNGEGAAAGRAKDVLHDGTVASVGMDSMAVDQDARDGNSAAFDPYPYDLDEFILGGPGLDQWFEFGFR